MQTDPVDREIDNWGFAPIDHPLLPEIEDQDEPDPDSPVFIDPIFPQGTFNLRDQDGNEDGPFDPDDFVRDPDGVWYTQTDGRPVFLRVLSQDKAHITSLDGAGDRWEYDMI